MEAYLNKLTSVDLSKLEDLPYDQLESVRSSLLGGKQLFYDYYFTQENKSVGVNKYSPKEVKEVSRYISSTLGLDIPYARLENGWILGKTHIHFLFNSPDFRDFCLRYEDMAKVSWHQTKRIFSSDVCSFCNPFGIYIAVECSRMGAIKKLFETYPSSLKKWEEKISKIIGKIDDLLKQKLSDSKSNILLELDKNSNGEIDLIENDFNKLLVQNQKKIIEIDRNYVQQFVKISNYIKTKRSNTQKIFESIDQTKNQKELEARANLVRNQVHTYEQLVFHSISMLCALVSDDMITFYEVYEAFDKLKIFNSNWQNEVSEKLENIGTQLNSLLVSIYQLENSIISELSSLSYATSESFSSLQFAMENQLSGIKSGISASNLLSGIQSYQLYRLNTNLLK